MYECFHVCYIHLCKTVLYCRFAVWAYLLYAKCDVNYTWVIRLIFYGQIPFLLPHCPSFFAPFGRFPLVQCGWTFPLAPPTCPVFVFYLLLLFFSILHSPHLIKADFYPPWYWSYWGFLPFYLLFIYLIMYFIRQDLLRSGSCCKGNLGLSWYMFLLVGHRKVLCLV